jgi:hypothetical protein
MAEATPQHHLEAVEVQGRPLPPAELRLLALALLKTDPSAHLLRVVTHLQHPAALLRTVEMRPTLPATPLSLKDALVHSASSQAAAALRPPVSSLTLVERTPFHSASSLRCAWLLWSPRSLSHSSQPTINILGHSAKVRHIDLAITAITNRHQEFGSFSLTRSEYAVLHVSFSHSDVRSPGSSRAQSP